MKEIRLRLIAIVLMVVCHGGMVMAQSILDNLTFPPPSKWIRPTGTNVNVRKSPAAKAARVCTIDKSCLYPVMEEQGQWYKTRDAWEWGLAVPTGWVSKQVATEATPAPIKPEMLNRYCGWSKTYEDWSEWIVSPPVGKHGLTLMYITGTNAPHCAELWLGKQVGNVFVFKYMVHLSIHPDADGPNKNKLSLEKETVDGELNYNLYVGANYLKEQRHGSYTEMSLDLTKFNDKMIEAIFGDEIRSGRTNWIAVTADRLSGRFTKYVLG